MEEQQAQQLPLAEERIAVELVTKRHASPPTTTTTPTKTASYDKESYGIIYYCPNSRSVLLIQNRDSEAFIFFFMARNIVKWEFRFFCRVIQNCSREEIERLLYYPFEEVYFDLYVNHQKGTFEKQVQQAQKNYRFFHEQRHWVQYAQQCHGTPIRWGFPKGRLEKDETFWQCAVRESKEELNLDDHHPLIQNVHEDKIATSFTYFARKQFFRFTVKIVLYLVHTPRSLYTPTYQQYPDKIRGKTISNEVLHSRWISIDELSSYVSEDLHSLLLQYFAKKYSFITT